MKRHAILTLLALYGCSAAGDPYAPRAGLWEVKTGFVTIEGPGVTPDRIEAVRKMGPQPTTERMCFDGHASQVGDVKPDGCKMTRMADAGAAVDREWQCPRRGRKDVAVTYRGSRGAERYDFRIATAAVEGRDKRPMIVTMREQGRRIGDCPAKP